MQSVFTRKFSSQEFPRSAAPGRFARVSLRDTRQQFSQIMMGIALLAMALLCGTYRASAEGSGAWGVTGNRQVNLFIPSTSSSGGGNTGYVTRGFMMLASNTG